MAIQASFTRKIFHFGFKARTSRGLMKDKTSWFIKLFDDNDPLIYGLGECGPLPGLSIDAVPEFEAQLKGVLEDLKPLDSIYQALKADRRSIYKVRDLVIPGFPSILFGVETALLDLCNGGDRIIFNNSFVKGKPILINGLIWMGDLDFMMRQINEKIAQGFRCIKLKVGGLDFDRECDVLAYIRKRYFREDITIRLDANGAFKTDDALNKLTALSKYNIHSIEQPVKPGLEVMEELCRKSSIPIAFDEELIGVEAREDKVKLLEKLKPRFIVLKPTLHGGLHACTEWIDIASHAGIGWWVTSALESNIGLNAICQFTANYTIEIPQGLGTGMIYENNFSSPLRIDQGNIFFDASLGWDKNLV